MTEAWCTACGIAIDPVKPHYSVDGQQVCVTCYWRLTRG